MSDMPTSERLRILAEDVRVRRMELAWAISDAGKPHAVAGEVIRCIKRFEYVVRVHERALLLVAAS